MLSNFACCLTGIFIIPFTLLGRMGKRWPTAEANGFWCGESPEESNNLLSVRPHCSKSIQSGFMGFNIPRGTSHERVTQCSPASLVFCRRSHSFELGEHCDCHVLSNSRQQSRAHRTGRFDCAKPNTKSNFSQRTSPLKRKFYFFGRGGVEPPFPPSKPKLPKSSTNQHSSPTHTSHSDPFPAILSLMVS